MQGRGEEGEDAIHGRSVDLKLGKGRRHGGRLLLFEFRLNERKECDFDRQFKQKDGDVVSCVFS